MEAVQCEDESPGLFSTTRIVSCVLLTTTPPSSQPEAHQHSSANENLRDLVILTPAAGFPRPLPIAALAKYFF